MKKILVIGAGRSSSILITYLLKEAETKNWEITVADQNEALAKEKTQGHPNASTAVFNIENLVDREALISENDLVISMLPATLHFPVAQSCLKHKKHLLTASYVSDEIAALSEEASKAGILILMETGLDPGLDHMSAMRELHAIQDKNGIVKTFKSYAGGLVAPESDNNPWHYKFTWNPKNVVLAGQGTVKFLEKGAMKYIPYNQIFKRTEEVHVKGLGTLEVYANRDSLRYLNLYNLPHAETFIRGTLRFPPFCAAWDILLQMGLSNDSFVVEIPKDQTWRAFLWSFLPETPGKTLEEVVAERFKISIYSEELKLLRWLGIFEENKIDPLSTTPAALLLKVLEEKWKLAPKDKDMIVMQHEFGYEEARSFKRIVTSLVVKGDEKYTAMAKTVGLPLGIAAKLVAEGKIVAKGVHIPITREIYTPILKELELHGIKFTVD